MDLGYQRGNAVSNIVNKFDEPANTSVFLSLFDQIWSDPDKLKDVTSLVCEHYWSWRLIRRCCGGAAGADHSLLLSGALWGIIQMTCPSTESDSAQYDIGGGALSRMLLE